MPKKVEPIIISAPDTKNGVIDPAHIRFVGRLQGLAKDVQLHLDPVNTYSKGVYLNLLFTGPWSAHKTRDYVKVPRSLPTSLIQPFLIANSLFMEDEAEEVVVADAYTQVLLPDIRVVINLSSVSIDAQLRFSVQYKRWKSLPIVQYYGEFAHCFTP